MRRFLAALLATLFTAGSALADDSALEKEGFWTVGRGDAGAKSCMASINVGETAILFIQVAPGHVDFVVGTKTPMRKGKQGVLIVGDQRFEFAPAYGDKRDLLFFEDVGARALAAARQARWVSAVVDGRELVSVNIENTGVAAALDAVVACSKGESGWWGPGVGGVATVADAADGGQGEPAVHKDGFWVVAPSDEPGFCVAAAKVDDDYTFAVVLGRQGMSFGVSSAKDMRRGRKGRLQTDAYRFDFKPEYESPTYFYPAEDLDSQGVFALRRARTVVVSIDGKAVVDMEFEGTGYAEVLADLAACGDGKKGWWGEGAKPR